MMYSYKGKKGLEKRTEMARCTDVFLEKPCPFLRKVGTYKMFCSLGFKIGIDSYTTEHEWGFTNPNSRLGGTDYVRHHIPLRNKTCISLNGQLKKILAGAIKLRDENRKVLAAKYSKRAEFQPGYVFLSRKELWICVYAYFFYKVVRVEVDWDDPNAQYASYFAIPLLTTGKKPKEESFSSSCMYRYKREESSPETDYLCRKRNGHIGVVAKKQGKYNDVPGLCKRANIKICGDWSGLEE
jgi:hypothetical protein